MPGESLQTPSSEAAELRSRDLLDFLIRAWPFIRPYKRHLLYLFLIMLPGLPAGLLVLYLVRITFDVIGNGQPLTAGEAWMLHLPLEASRRLVLWRATMVAAGAAAFLVPLGFFMLCYAVWILQRISNLFRVNLYTRLQGLSLHFHSEEKIGDEIFRMFQDAAAIPSLIDGLVFQPVRFLPFALANLVWLGLFNLTMTLIALAYLAANVIVAWMFTQPMRRCFRRAREAAAAATTRVEETLASIKTVKAFGREESEHALFGHDNWDAFIAARSARMLMVYYRLCINTLRAFAYVAALYLGAKAVLAGQTGYAALSLGLFQGTLAVFSAMTNRSRRLIDLWGSLQDCGVAMGRVFAMLDTKSETEVAQGRGFPTAVQDSLAFEAVTFCYPGAPPVLNRFSFQARVGEITAIAGASGSGKSTSIALAMRFFDPAAGRILLDGRDVRELDLVGYRALASVSLQESPLLSTSLRDNVAYGRPQATEQEINAALELAGLADFARSLPAGLDTIVGEKGAKVSVGQAQRISLARAILRDAPIMLLDEPTSALDPATEAHVMRWLRRWVDAQPQRRMVLLATHRQSTAVMADRIYYLGARDSSAAQSPPGATAVRGIGNG
jgi:ATP-binding cassette, subfamily B, bacterial